MYKNRNKTYSIYASTPLLGFITRIPTLQDRAGRKPLADEKEQCQELEYTKTRVVDFDL